MPESVSIKSTYFAKEGETNMSKLLTTLIAAVFAAVAFTAVAADAPKTGDAPKAEAKKKTDKAKKPAKSKKQAKKADKK
jgi:hypothetical protein